MRQLIKKRKQKSGVTASSSNGSTIRARRNKCNTPREDPISEDDGKECAQPVVCEENPWGEELDAPTHNMGLIIATKLPITVPEDRPRELHKATWQLDVASNISMSEYCVINVASGGGSFVSAIGPAYDNPVEWSHVYRKASGYARARERVQMEQASRQDFLELFATKMRQQGSFASKKARGFISGDAFIQRQDVPMLMAYCGRGVRITLGEGILKSSSPADHHDTAWVLHGQHRMPHLLLDYG